MSNKESISPEEFSFKEKHPEAYKRYKLYANYYTFKTGKNLLKDKDYETSIVKGLIAFFLYKETMVTKKEMIALLSISKLLGYVAHTGAIHAINRVKAIMKQPKYKMKGKYIRVFFVAFNDIFIQSIKQNNKKKRK